MEVITAPVKSVDVDYMAEQVFQESIKILGGLKRLIEFRNLTWLPSLAEASYAVVMKNELYKSYREIAIELGITEQTVKNILKSDEEEVKRFLEGEIESVDEHKAGGIAKLAYRKVKENEGVFIRKDEMEVLGVEWALHVLMRLKGTDFPLDADQLKEKLAGLVIKGKPVEEIIEGMNFPVKSPADVLHQIKNAIS